MDITLKYKCGDKVWFNVESNQYTYGEIESLNVKVCLKNKSVEVFYHVKNRHCVRDRYSLLMDRSWKSETYLTFLEQECFSSKTEVIEYIKSKYQERIDTISEYKSGKWFES